MKKKIIAMLVCMLLSTTVISAASADGFGILGDNQPPDQPQKPWVVVDEYVEYIISSLTVDPESDYIYYMFEWGDETNTTWLGPHPSGTVESVKHEWDAEGEYSVRVKAKDVYDAESIWSEPTIVVYEKRANLAVKKINGGLGTVKLKVDNKGTATATDIKYVIQLKPEGRTKIILGAVTVKEKNNITLNGTAVLASGFILGIFGLVKIDYRIDYFNGHFEDYCQGSRTALIIGPLIIKL